MKTIGILNEMSFLASMHVDTRQAVAPPAANQTPVSRGLGGNREGKYDKIMSKYFGFAIIMHIKFINHPNGSHIIVSSNESEIRHCIYPELCKSLKFL